MSLTKGMNLTPRHHAYYWVTWLTKLLAGENMCVWAAWLKGHYKYEKQESTGFDIDNWTMQHTALLRDRAETLKGQGFTVTLEDQNPFSVVGKNGSEIAGKMDIVAAKAKMLLIEDGKTGKKRTSDHAQVGIYMMFHPDRKGKEVFGNVIYPDSVVKVNPMDPQLLSKLMKQLEAEPPCTPSARECKFCDIAQCKSRFVSKRKAVYETDLF